MPHILLVDDDPIFRQSVSDYLTTNRYRVTVAKSGYQVLEILDESVNFDLILCDIDMPDMDGFELLDILQQKFMLIPIVMLTGDRDPRTIVTALQTGAMNYVVKSRVIGELLATIEHTIEQHQKNIKQIRRIIKHLPKIDIEAKQEREPSTHLKLQLNSQMLRACFDHQPIALTETEFKILQYLVDAMGDVRTYEEIMCYLHGEPSTYKDSLRGLATHIANLRRKLEEVNCDKCILTRRSRGYYINSIYL